MDESRPERIAELEQQLAELRAEIEKIRAETEKIRAETEEIRVETEKIRAETAAARWAVQLSQEAAGNAQAPRFRMPSSTAGSRRSMPLAFSWLEMEYRV
jgi:regulator of replication initiation timing